MPWTIDSSGTKSLTGPQTVTVTLASPGVFTLTNHGLLPNDRVMFTSSGTIAQGLVQFANYFVLSGSLTANAFTVSGTLSGAAINTSTTQSGTMTGTFEHMLLISGTNATYQYAGDLINGNLGGTGIVLAMRIYDAVDGANPRQAWKGSYSANPPQAVNNPAMESPFQPLNTSGWFTASLLAGPPSMNFPWRVLRQ